MELEAFQINQDVVEVSRNWKCFKLPLKVAAQIGIETGEDSKTSVKEDCKTKS